MFWCFLFLFCCLPFRVWASRSGIYIDNGVDQTVLDMAMSDEETKELKTKLLDFLGLPGERRNDGKSGDLKRPAPRFLLDVYERLKEEDGEGGRKRRDVEINLSKEEQDAIDVSDLIMTFESVDSEVSGVRHEKGKRLWFNVSEIPLSESIIGAELRIYQDGNIAKKRKDRRYTVSVFELSQNNVGEMELEYVSSTNTTATFTGWLQLNLTKSVANWAAFPNLNRGLYLSVHPFDKPSHEVKPEDLGLITAKGESPMQPFMVVFLKSADSTKPRHVRDIYYTRFKKSTLPTYGPIFNRDPYSGEELRTCNIHTLYVDFNALNWSSWIIAPEGFSANYCFGKCDFPLNARVNATNHAIVQSMMHLLINHLEYPKPCCTPMKLHPMSVLFYGDDNSVMLKKYKNMIVKHCGCH